MSPDIVKHSLVKATQLSQEILPWGWTRTVSDLRPTLVFRIDHSGPHWKGYFISNEGLKRFWIEWLSYFQRLHCFFTLGLDVTGGMYSIAKRELVRALNSSWTCFLRSKCSLTFWRKQWERANSTHQGCLECMVCFAQLIADHDLINTEFPPRMLWLARPKIGNGINIWLLCDDPGSFNYVFVFIWCHKVITKYSLSFLFFLRL